MEQRQNTTLGWVSEYYPGLGFKRRGVRITVRHESFAYSQNAVYPRLFCCPPRELLYDRLPVDGPRCCHT